MIIGVTGLIGSGKDTIADYLCTFHGFKRLSFAASLKDAVSNIFGWDRELLEGSTKASREWREKVDIWWTERLGMEITPRWILQHFGTEVCRNSFHKDIWIASLENKLRNCTDNVVITDCRFLNEIQAIKNAGGTTFRVSRGVDPSWCVDAVIFNCVSDDGERESALNRLIAANIHASEYSSVGLEYDYHIDNNGTIDELHKHIKSIINL